MKQFLSYFFILFAIQYGAFAGPYEKLKEYNIELASEAQAPTALLIKARRSGNLVFVSGHIAKKDGKVIAGKFGRDFKANQGEEITKLIAIDLISTLHEFLGNLENIKQIVKITGFVNSTPNFNEAHLVINGASKVFINIFGESGKHARSAISVTSLPFGSAAEIELIVEVKK